MKNDGELFGVLAQFDDPSALMQAARGVRDAGYTRWDCYTPFPVHGLDQAMGMRDTRVPWVVLGAGATGLAAAILMQWWMNAVDYQFVLSGKPLFSLPAQIPIAFELTVLFASLSAFFGMFAFNKLPQFYHPVFRSARFKRATTDRYFIGIESADPKFDPQKTELLLEKLGSSAVEWLED